MRALLSRFIGVFIFLSILTTNVLTPIALAQDGNSINCSNPEEYTANKEYCAQQMVGADDILQAINSQTPNLANTTAYVFYTILVILTGSLNPDSLNTNDASPETSYSASPDQMYASNQEFSIQNSVESAGLVGGVTFLIAQMVKNEPASAQEYVSYMVKESRLTPDPVYAQGFGIGFGGLSPILGTWAAFRDVAYFLLTVMFLVTGFLIIIRHKVSGNVAVTVQNALPRLVITLLLITFSYAIAGFVVDLMFWAIYFIVYIFSSLFDSSTFSLIGKDRTIAQMATDTSIFRLFFNFAIETGAMSNAAESISSLLQETANSILGDTIEKIINFLTFGMMDNILKFIFMLIITVAMLVQVLRVFFQLLMSYAGFVINVVLSPFILLQGAIPGKDPFMDWFKNLLAGLAPFVVVIFMMFMAYVLTGTNTIDGVGYNKSGDNVGLRLPLILTQDVSADAFLGILAIGFIMLLPEAVNMTKEFMGAKGGPMDKYKDKAMQNFQKGWEGGEVVPGVGFTKVPGAQRFTFGSSESRKKEGAKDYRERTVPSRLWNYGAMGGGLGVAGSVLRRYPASRAQEEEGLIRARTQTPTVVSTNYQANVNNAPPVNNPPRGNTTPQQNQNNNSTPNSNNMASGL